MIDFRGSTQQFNGITLVPAVDVEISEAFDASSGSPQPTTNKYYGVWDTGASRTVISSKVVGDLGLKPTGKAITHTANGTTEASTYFINIVLPNKSGISGLRVTEGKLPSGVDVLVGMDIISTGDFSITNTEGKTCISFRRPSVKRVDYVEEARAIIRKRQEVSDPIFQRRLRNQRKRERKNRR
jgi:hypothetical protein